MRNLALVCGGLAIVSSIISVNLWRELRAERLMVGELRAQLLEQQGRFATVSMPTPGPQVTTPASVPAAAPATAPPLPESRNNGPQTAAQARDSLTDALARQRDLMNDPEYRRARLEQLRLTMPQNWPGVVEELNLTPDQADALFDLLAAQQMKQSELVVPITAVGASPDAAMVRDYTRQVEELTRERDEKVAALLGTAAAERFTAYEQTRPARSQARSMQRQLEDSGMTPLRPEQSRALTDAYISAQQAQRDSIQQRVAVGANNPADLLNIQMEIQTERNRRLVDSVRPHFSPQQVERLQASLEQQLAMNRATMRLSRERLEAQQQASQENRGAVNQGPPAAAFQPF